MNRDHGSPVSNSSEERSKRRAHTDDESLIAHFFRVNGSPAKLNSKVGTFFPWKFRWKYRGEISGRVSRLVDGWQRPEHASRHLSSNSSNLPLSSRKDAEWQKNEQTNGRTEAKSSTAARPLRMHRRNSAPHPHPLRRLSQNETLGDGREKKKREEDKGRKRHGG